MPYPCPECCQSYPCDNDCDAGPPTTISLTLSGVADEASGCSNGTWPTMDGSYTLPYQGCTKWSTYFEDISESVEMINLSEQCKGYGFSAYATYRLYMLVRIEADFLVAYIEPVGFGQFILSEKFEFRLGITRPETCCDWLDYDLPYIGAEYGNNNDRNAGDLSGATCTITSGAGGCP